LREAINFLFVKWCEINVHRFLPLAYLLWYTRKINIQVNNGMEMMLSMLHHIQQPLPIKFITGTGGFSRNVGLRIEIVEGDWQGGGSE
jgi:hypothetical protein